MPTQYIKRTSSTFPALAGTPHASPIYVDSDDSVIKYIPAASGTTEVQLLDTASAQTVTGVKTLASPVITGAGIDFNGGTFTNHPLDLESITLASNTNVIRGASVNPTRASGWISFSGTIGATPAQCYTDYRELHTTGVAEVLGIGSFPYMDSGASCASLFAGQFISFVSSGSTVTTAAAAPLVGVYAIVAKTTVDSATVNSGAQIGAIALSVQANVTDISGEASCIAYLEVASGAVRDLFFINATGGAMATNLFRFSAAVSPLTTGGSGTPTAASGTWYNLRCSVNGTAAYIPISTAAWTNA